MFEELFTRSITIERYLAAPLAEDRLRYLQHLRDSGSRKSTLQRMAAAQFWLVRLLDLRDADRVDVSRIEAATKMWSCLGAHRHDHPALLKARAVFIGRAIRWLRFLGRLDEPGKVRHPHTDEVAVFAAWMCGERGLSAETIRVWRAGADEFFDWLAASDTPLASVSITDIDRAIVEKNSRRTYSRRTIKNYAECLRVFFRFAENQGWCMPGMAAAIIPPRIYPNQPVPAGLTREDVLRLLVSTEGDRPIDVRDRAILMLLATYGLRAGEVRVLQLDNLDWEEETLRVRRPKPGRTHLYPLSRGAGQAILNYILEVRPPRPERTLFFTLRAPFRSLGRSSLGNIVHRRLNRLGIVSGRRGPHALRHAAAQHLLDQGMSMKVIGDFLGHRNPSSTAVYAKVKSQRASRSRGL